MAENLDPHVADLPAREEPPLFFILPGTELGLDDFIRQRGDAQHVVLRDEIQQSLITRYRKSVVERYDQKRAYLRRLYAALRGKRDSVTEREAMAAAKAFSMSFTCASGNRLACSSSCSEALSLDLVN